MHVRAALLFSALISSEPTTKQANDKTEKIHATIGTVHEMSMDNASSCFALDQPTLAVSSSMQCPFLSLDYSTQHHHVGQLQPHAIPSLSAPPPPSKFPRNMSHLSITLHT